MYLMYLYNGETQNCNFLFQNLKKHSGKEVSEKFDLIFIIK